MPDQIVIEGMQVMGRIGVTDEERGRSQKLEISVSLQVDAAAAAQTDDLAQTVDYALVQQRILEATRERSRKLIETLAEDIAQSLLRNFKTRKVEVRVAKFILENTQSVSVRITRLRQNSLSRIPMPTFHTGP